MTEPVRPLEALIAETLDEIQAKVQQLDVHQMTGTFDGQEFSYVLVRRAQVHEILNTARAALLQAAAPPAPTAEQEITRALDLARKALFTPPNGALVCRWCHANWTTDGHTEWCHYVEICRDISDASEAIRIAQTKMRSAAPPERVSEGKRPVLRDPDGIVEPREEPR